MKRSEPRHYTSPLAAALRSARARTDRDLPDFAPILRAWATRRAPLPEGQRRASPLRSAFAVARRRSNAELANFSAAIAFRDQLRQRS